MGFCLSCCRRRKVESDSERQPLLPASDHQQAQSPLGRIADVLAALHSGKLPSQDQISAALRRVLYSDLLRVDKRLGNDVLNAEGKGVIGDVREVVQALLQVGIEKNDDNRIQDLIYTYRQLNSIPVRVKESPHAKYNQESTAMLAAPAIPTEAELANDTAALFRSVRTLISLILTSSAFRLILSDVLLTAREMVADTVGEVRKTAQMVEGVATAVEETVRPGVRNTEFNETVDEQPEEQTEVQGYEARDLKEIVLDRVEDIIRQAQASPSYNTALRTILYLLRKYATRAHIASLAMQQAASCDIANPIEVSAPIIAPDAQLTRVSEDVKVLLERFAGGRSLDEILSLLSKIVNEIASVPDHSSDSGTPVAQDYFDRVGLWLDTALTDTQFAQSRVGRVTASRLYDEGRAFLRQDGQLQSDLHQLVQEVQAFTYALQNDRTTSHLVRAISSLQTSFKAFIQASARQGRYAPQHWRFTALRLLLGWVLPRILSAVKTIPMPRVEYMQKDGKGRTLAVALDALLLSATEELVPDVLAVQEWGEVRLELDEEIGAAGLGNINVDVMNAKRKADAHSDGHLAESLLPDTRHEQDATGPQEAGPSMSATEFEQAYGHSRHSRVISSSQIRIHMEGLRLEAHDLGYYARYDLNSWIGYEDEGLMSIDIGKHRKRSEGLGLDIELELDTDNIVGQAAEDKRLFKVISVKTSLPGLALRISQSKHWILNSILLAPIAGPIGRAVGARILAAQVGSALEKLEEVVRGMKGKVDEKAQERSEEGVEESDDSRLWDWWEAILEKFGSAKSPEDEDEDEEQDVYTESHTNVTLKGVVHETYTQREPSPVRARSPKTDHVEPPTESALAVGLGAQLLPGKAEPIVERESLEEVIGDVAHAELEVTDDVREASKTAGEAVGEGIRRAAEVRKEIGSAEERLKERERIERRKRGWRSRAFDL